MAKFSQYPLSNDDVATQLRNLVTQLNFEFSVPPLIEVTDFTNSWVNYGEAIYTNASYYKRDGRVYLGGLVKLGTIGMSIYTLPIGCRPSKQLIFSTVSNSSFAELRVSDNGEVTPISGNNAWVSLENISFKVD